MKMRAGSRASSALVRSHDAPLGEKLRWLRWGINRLRGGAVLFGEGWNCPIWGGEEVVLLGEGRRLRGGGCPLRGGAGLSSDGH